MYTGCIPLYEILAVHIVYNLYTTCMQYVYNVYIVSINIHLTQCMNQLNVYKWYTIYTMYTY